MRGGWLSVFLFYCNKLLGTELGSCLDYNLAQTLGTELGRTPRGFWTISNLILTIHYILPRISIYTVWLATGGAVVGALVILRKLCTAADQHSTFTFVQITGGIMRKNGTCAVGENKLWKTDILSTVVHWENIIFCFIQ